LMIVAFITRLLGLGRCPVRTGLLPLEQTEINWRGTNSKKGMESVPPVLLRWGYPITLLLGVRGLNPVNAVGLLTNSHRLPAGLGRSMSDGYEALASRGYFRIA